MAVLLGDQSCLFAQGSLTGTSQIHLHLAGLVGLGSNLCKPARTFQVMNCCSFVWPRALCVQS